MMIVQPKYTNFVVSFSFKNYLKAKSGMPKVILSHQTVINGDKTSYVYLYSVKKTVFNDKAMLFCFYGLIIDGIDYGVFSMKRIIKMINDWLKLGYVLMNFHIHHLLYTDVKKLEQLLDSFSLVQIKFFLHDYYLCCKSYNLLNDKGESCGAKCLNNDNCHECAFYADSIIHEEKLHRIVNKYLNRTEFFAPSESTKNIYISYWPEVESLIKVMPHQRFKGVYSGNLSLLRKDGPIRVGYLGVPEDYKGWSVWQQLVNNNQDNTLYEFYVFNNRTIEYKNMHHIIVEYSENKQNAMVDAVRSNKIDAVVFWPKVRETYSYTCMEAYACNAFIITNETSGNIQSFVKKENAGIVLTEINALFELFDNHDLFIKRINEFREVVKPGPLELIDNDSVCKLYEKQKDNNVVSEYRLHKSVWSRIMEYLYNNHVQKY